MWALASGVFFPNESLEAPQKHVDPPSLKRWESLLGSGYASLACDEAQAYLDHLAQSGALDAENLQLFYQSVLQMLCNAAETASVPPGGFLPEQKLFQRSLNTYLTIDDVKNWMSHAFRAFQADAHPKKTPKARWSRSSNISRTISSGMSGAPRSQKNSI